MNYYGHVSLAYDSPGLRPQHTSTGTWSPYTAPEPVGKEGLSEDRTRRPSKIRFKSLFPTLAVVFSTWGLGLGVLAWVYVKLRIPMSTAFQKGYLLVDEGIKWQDSMESATLRTLTATSAISTLISLTSSLLMALMAYRVAHLWMAEERSSSTLRSTATTGPTPLQYGLLVQILSASGVMSLYNSIKYMCKGKSRAHTPSYFKSAVWLGVLVSLITKLVGVADLWLHATTSAVVYNLTISDGSTTTPLMTSIAFNNALCDEYDAPIGDRICLTGSDGWANMIDDEHIIRQGEAIIANYSSDRRVITLADEADLAIVVPLTVDKFATFRATSFGALAQCQSLNTQCVTEESRVDCSNLGIYAIPLNSNSARSMALVAPYDEWNSTAAPDSNLNYGPANCCGTNPVRSILQLGWASQRSGSVEPPNPAVFTGQIPLLNIFAMCDLTFFNVTVSYDGRAPSQKSWSLIREGTTQSDEVFATTLSAPFAWQLITENLTANIKSRAMLAQSTDEVMAALNQELARLALGYVASAFAFIPATRVEVFKPTVLGRYPVAPLLTFVGLLFLYGLVALGI
ncbi:hypothetical protein FRC09_018078, partial [Ceratobasidium sp. 395]